MDDKARIAAITAEMRAAELVRALRHALAGAPYWRWEARQLLTVIDNGELPERRQEAA
jgi:hypothetical protein